MNNTPLHAQAHIQNLRAIIAHSKHNAKSETEKLRAERIEQGRKYWAESSQDLRRIVIIAVRSNVLDSHTKAKNLNDDQCLELNGCYQRMISFLDKAFPDQGAA